MAGDLGQAGNPNQADLTAQAAQATIDSAKAAKRSALISVISVIVTLIVGASGFYSVYLARQQNNNAQQQALLSLAGEIAQEPQQQAQASENIKNNPALLNNVVVELQLTELGEGEQAYNIIQRLPKSVVSSAEEYLVGEALEAGDDFEPALKLLTSAANEETDPRTESDSWREAARILYLLGLNSQAEQDMVHARESFNRQGVTPLGVENNLALTDLWDVPFQVHIDCSTATAEWDQAIQIIMEDRSALSVPLSVDETSARADLISTCHAAPGALKVVPPLPQSEG